VPVGPVNTNEMLYDDPHLQAREMLVALETPGAERPTVFANSPIKFSRTKSGANRRAPLLGEHDAEVRAEMVDDDHGDGSDYNRGQTRDVTSADYIAGLTPDVIATEGDVT